MKVTEFKGNPVISEKAIDIMLSLDKQVFVMNMMNGGSNDQESAMNQPAASLSLYPNPANDWVDISMKGISTDNFTLEVYNADGMRMLLQQPWDGRGIDVSKFPTGIYILSLKRDREIYTQKLMIQR
ncbi:MAG: T9SS type A sorting domain-containing protein [Sphingobacteriaceae bacterium]